MTMTMTKQSPALALALLLCGCPVTAPNAASFAFETAGGAAIDADLAGTDATTSAGDSAAIDSQAPDKDGESADAGLGVDTIVSDIAAADVSPVKGPCANNVGLFTKVFDSGGSEGIFGVSATTDGGALLVGDAGANYKPDVLLLRIGQFGGTIWSKTYGGAEEDHGRAAISLADGFAVAGTTRSKGAGYGDGWLLRTDADGKLLWDKTYGGTGDDALYGIAAAANGFVLAGANRSLSGGLEDGWLIRTDASGEMLWQQKYGGSSIDELFAVVALPDGSFAAAGANRSISSSGSDAWLLLVDGKGVQTKSKVFGFGETDDARALTRMADGGFALTGAASSGNPDLWVIRTDADGNLQWKDVVPGNQSETGRGIAAWPDGSLVVAGATDSQNPSGSSSGEDGWLLRYDAWGNRLWNQRYGDAGNQWGEGVLVYPDGGMLMVGRRYDQATTMDAWFLRVDAWGHADCGLAGACKSKQPSDCDDGNACTIDRCDNMDGCVHAGLPLGVVCGKGAVCGDNACIGP